MLIVVRLLGLSFATLVLWAVLWATYLRIFLGFRHLAY